MKTIYECPLVDDTRRDKTAGSGMVEFRIKCGPLGWKSAGTYLTHLQPADHGKDQHLQLADICMGEGASLC